MNAPELAQRLAHEGYAGLFLAGDSSTAGDVFDGNAAALEAIVGDAGAGDLERVLAAEVLYRCGDGPGADRDVLAGIYTRALALTGSHTLPGNLWGALWATPGDDGPLGTHLVAQGEAVVPGLLALLGDEIASPTRAAARRRRATGGAIASRTPPRSSSAVCSAATCRSTRPTTSATRRSAGSRPPLPADPDELERQLERGTVFTHTVLSEQAERGTRPTQCSTG